MFRVGVKMSRGYRWNRLMAVFLLLWLIGVGYFVSTLMTKTSEKETALQRQESVASQHYVPRDNN